MKHLRITLVLVISILFSTFYANAQVKERKAFRPDIPGNFIVEFGFNGGLNRPNYFSPTGVGSRTVNIIYQYPIRIGKTKFTYNPGVGVGLERFKLGDYTLTRSAGSDGSYSMIRFSDLYANTSVRKSMLVANYIDLFPAEIRFDTNPDDKARSFNVTIGGKLGILFDSFTKVKYTEVGTTKLLKDKQSHGLNGIRYGLYTRIGVGSVGFFWNYNFSPYFAANAGPDKTAMNTMTIGISFNGF